MLLLLALLADATPVVVFDGVSPYERVFVVDEGPLRYLRFGTAAGDDQSVIHRHQPDRLVMDYLRLALHGLVDVARRERALVIGLGAGSFVRALERIEPVMKIDAVDIDPLVVEVAKRWFGFQPTTRVSVFVEDAAAFVRRDGTTYDLILLDAYGAGGVPPPLGTPEFFAAVAKRLARGGVVVANLSVEPAEERSLLAAMAKVFAVRRCLWTADGANVIVFARGRALIDGVERGAAVRRLRLEDAARAELLGDCP